MTDFVRTRAGNFPSNGTVASSEMSDIDQKTAKALNRYGGSHIDVGVGGDDGSVTWNNGTLCNFGSGSSCVFSSGSTCSLQGTATMTFAGTSYASFGSGTSCKFQVGSALVLYGTIFPSFSAPRTRIVTIPLLAMGTVSGGVNASVNGIVTGSTGLTYAWAFQPPHNAATISQVDVLWAPATNHTSLAALVPPVMSVMRHTYTAGVAAGTGVYLGSSNFQSYSPVSLSDYNNGTTHVHSYTCDQNNVVDTSTSCYWVSWTDESGADAKINAIVGALRIHYTAINDMQFP